MVKHKKIRVFALLLILILVFNTVTISKVQASSGGIVLTLSEVAANSGGLASFGSAALGVAIPLLLAAGTVYAGYKIYQNREAITKTFYNWYTSASTAVKTKVSEWMEDFQAAFDAGTITDGSTVEIPIDVLNAVDSFISEVNASYDNNDVTFLDEEIVNISSLNIYVTNPALKALLSASTYTSKAPVVILTNISTGEEKVYFNTGSNLSIFFINEYFSKLVFYYLPLGKLISGTTTLGDNATRPNYIGTYFTGSGYTTKSGNEKLELPYTNIIINGNTVTGESWNYSMQLILPAGSSVVKGTELESYTTLTPLLYDVIATNASEVSNPFVVGGYTYTPTITVGADGLTDVLEVPLTPEVVNALNDYIVKDISGEKEVVAIIDPKGLTETDDPTVPGDGGILDGIREFFGNLLDSILNFLKSILDAILAIPGQFNNFLTTLIQGITDAVTAIPGLIEDIITGIGDVIDGILDIPGEIVAGISAFIESLFVPDAIVVDEFVNHVNSKIEGQSGILTYPLSLVILFLNQVLTLGSSDCILTIPEINVMGHNIMDAYSLNLSLFVRKSEFSEVYSTYILITNFIMILGVVTLAIKKGDQIIRGN